MIASRWMALRTWHEQIGMQEPGAPVTLALPFLRPALLLWLSTLAEPDWVGLDDLADHISTFCPDWIEPALGLPPSETPPVNDETNEHGTPKPSNGHSAASHLEQALASSIDAAIAAEQYAAAKGFSVRFGSEDLRAMALSLFIQGAREGGLR